MPVQPAVSLEQIVIIVAFLMLLFGITWFIRRHRGGITRRIHADRRMTHIEDLSLAPQQRLHLIEVDGRTFLVHAGKGHAASFIAVDGTPADGASSATPDTTPRRQTKSATKKSAPASGTTSGAKAKSTFAAAIAQARRNNPSVEFGT
jgi:flagellar biogenesis protein FliO